MARQFAIQLGLIAFSTASLRGLISGADFEGTLQTALIATGVFYVLGLVFGELARRVVEECVQSEFDRLVALETQGEMEDRRPAGA